MLFLEHLQQCAEYVTLDSKIKCLCLTVFFGGNPTNKTQTAYTWATINTKPPGPIIVIDQREILSRNQVQFSTHFLGGAQLCCAFHNQPPQAAQIWCRKANFLS
jgi:hypothetical protein